MSDTWRVTAVLDGSSLQPLTKTEGQARHHFEQYRRFIANGRTGYASISVNGFVWDHVQSAGYVRRVDPPLRPERCCPDCEESDE